MVYLIVSIALLALGIKGYCGKKTSGFMRNIGDSFLMNTIRFLLCILVGLVFVLIETESLKIDGGMLAICVFSGITMALNVGFWALAVKYCAMSTLDVMTTLSSIIPAVLCSIFFGETFSWMKMIGFTLIVIASFFMMGYNRSIKGKGSILGKILMLLTVLGDAFFSFSQQIYKQFRTVGGMYADGKPTYSKTVFNFYIYIFAAITLSLFFIIYALTTKDKKEVSLNALSKNTYPALPFIAIMAICLFIANFMQTAATNDFNMPSQILYPIIKAGCLIMNTLTAAIFFGEKPNKKSYIGLSFALIGIVLINIL